MRYAALIVALLTLSVGVAPALAVASAGDTPVAPTPGQSASLDGTPAVVGSTVLQTAGDNETPRTTITIDLRSNTSARWTLTTRQSLDSDEERAAFRDLVAEFEAGGAGVDSDVATFRNYARQAENYTGRQMAIRRVDPSGRIDETNETGVLNLSFTWTNFAERTESDRLRVKDAFLRADGESWFPRLTADQRLVIQGPDDYNTYTTPSAARQQGNTVIFDSGQELDPETVYATFQPESQDPSLVAQILVALGWPVALGAILLVAVVGVVAFVRYRRDDSPPPASEATPPDADSGRPGQTEAAGGAGAAAGAADAAETTDADETEASDEEEVDLELLSDEERVEHLLEQNGGRMKQASIVKETGWSDAKVSQLLSAMAEEDRINKLRLGRENLISLPDEDDPV
jgi:uncharacterized membrane protein